MAAHQLTSCPLHCYRQEGHCRRGQWDARGPAAADLPNDQQLRPFQRRAAAGQHLEAAAALRCVW